MSAIHINITQSLADILEEKGIEQQDYMPAYNGESAGLDLYATKTMEYPIMTDSPVTLIIPTGLRVAIPTGYVGFIKGRGSQTKANLNLLAGVIDSGYTGEVFVAARRSDRFFAAGVEYGQKLPFQLVVTPVFNNYRVTSSEIFEAMTTRRGTGKIGSSDK